MEGPGVGEGGGEQRAHRARVQLVELAGAAPRVFFFVGEGLFRE